MPRSANIHRDPATRSHLYVTRQDIARMAGVGIRTVDKWIETFSRRDDLERFPAPVGVDRRAMLYLRTEVEVFLARRGMLPVGLPDLARMLHVSEDGIRSLYESGSLPDPDFMTMKEPMWWYPPMRAFLFSNRSARRFLVGEAALEDWIRART